jgi:hypothetical protein
MTDAPQPELLAAYRNALMWAFDRLGVDGGMTAKEQLHTMREIGKVLCGRASPAATYKPNDWDSSAAIAISTKRPASRQHHRRSSPMSYAPAKVRRSL